VSAKVLLDCDASILFEAVIMHSEPVRLPDAQLSHVGLYVRDLEKMVAFYCRVLGMVISDKGPFGDRTLAFLTRKPTEHHQLVMICDPARANAGPSSVNQLSFLLNSLEDLRQYYAFLSEMNADGLDARDHGSNPALACAARSERFVGKYYRTNPSTHARCARQSPGSRMVG